ncbi:Pycsar system effector family protein [Streptomyces bottropensis]|uniref:Mobile element trasfer protein n=1 Tax=Streptomyces bottropensis ATCC 25435 TaxID=1054862 RepID=M3FWD4_9ACTN|nr:Pycsar system effector family protein [Streptomyces bottropensis]EMF57305.1 mobile element trasfer protein [Streptomyces bottropensis ATCC 25435]MZD19228.1 integral membrane plasmid transfer protein [Streptomyces sp. SID5476]
MNAADQNLTAAHAEVKAEIARTDTKTGLLLAFIGAVLAGAWTVAKDAPLNLPAYIVGGAGMVVLVTAAGLLLRAVRPNLKGRHGFPLWATLTADEITATLAQVDRSADIAGLSRLAVVKFTGLRRAIDLTCAGGALLALAVLVAVVGGAA